MFIGFESFVNSERYKTEHGFHLPTTRFESFVNSERYKTKTQKDTCVMRLRALLIQKDTKLITVEKFTIQFESFVNSERYKT